MDKNPANEGDTGSEQLSSCAISLCSKPLKPQLLKPSRPIY